MKFSLPISLLLIKPITAAWCSFHLPLFSVGAAFHVNWGNPFVESPSESKPVSSLRLSGFGGAVEGTPLASSMHLPVQGSDTRLSAVLTKADQFQALSLSKSSCLFPKGEFPHLHQLHLHHTASCSFPSLPAALLAGSQSQRFLWPVGSVRHRPARRDPRGPAAEGNVRRPGSTRDGWAADCWPWARHLTSACLS